MRHRGKRRSKEHFEKARTIYDLQPPCDVGLRSGELIIPQIFKKGYGCGSQLSSSQVACANDVRCLHSDEVRLVFVRTFQVAGWVFICFISPHRGPDYASLAEDRHPVVDSDGALIQQAPKS
jgi:hypothetical protein